MLTKNRIHTYHVCVLPDAEQNKLANKGGIGK